MSGIFTASLRFSGKLNGDSRKMSVNLVSFARADDKHVKVTVQEITHEVWSSPNFLANVKPEDGKYFSVSCGCCGNITTQEVDEEIAKVQQKMNGEFVTWIPNNIKSSIITVSPEDTPMNGTFVALKSVF